MSGIKINSSSHASAARPPERKEAPTPSRNAGIVPPSASAAKPAPRDGFDTRSGTVTNQRVSGSTTFQSRVSGGAETVPVPPELEQWKGTMVDIAKKVAADTTLKTWGDRENAVKSELSRTGMTEQEQHKAYAPTMQMVRAELYASGGGADDRRGGGISAALMMDLDANSGSLSGLSGKELDKGIKDILDRLDVKGQERRPASDYLYGRVGSSVGGSIPGLIPEAEPKPGTSSSGSNTGIVPGGKPGATLPLSPRLERHRRALEAVADKLSGNDRLSQAPQLRKALWSELKGLRLDDAQRQEARRHLLDSLAWRRDRDTE